VDSPAAGWRSGAVGGRKDSPRAKHGDDAGRTVAGARKLPALARFINALSEEGIRFQIAGMSAAILQGAPATTLDTDIWVNLPERQFVRLNALVQAEGGTMLAPNVAALSDDTLLNFLPRVDGLRSFAAEYKESLAVKWHGREVRVLPLQKIIQSKEFVGRPKDIAHLPLLRQTLRIHQAAHPKY